MKCIPFWMDMTSKHISMIPKDVWKTKNVCTRWYRTQRNNEKKKGDLLLLSSTFAWPESDASAAGVRTEALLKYFQSSSSSNNSNNLFENVLYGTGRKPPSPSLLSHPKKNNFSIHYFPLNQEQTIKDLLLQDETFSNVKVVIFDRYYTEEAYSFYFYKHRPDIVRILDMQDMHSLRQMRQDIVHQYDKMHAITTKYNNNNDYKNPNHYSPRMTKSLMNQLMTVIPEIQQQEDISTNQKKKRTFDKFVRELTAIHRSDITMVCSPTEMKLLQQQFQIPLHKLVLAPFFVSPSSYRQKTTTTTHNQNDEVFPKNVEFVMLGGFLHEPNVDSVQYVNYELWPRIYEQIRNENPNVSIHIYGAHLSNKLKHQILHQNRNTNFYLHGKADTLDRVFGHKDQTKKILLAPLRFGAGIKGKIIEAWKHDCPVITTPIGAEGMTFRDSFMMTQKQSNKDKTNNFNHWQQLEQKYYDDWGGLIASDTDSLVDSAVKLYHDEELWNKCRNKGHELLQCLYNDKYHFNAIQTSIEEAMQTTMNRRKYDYTYGMLWHQTFRSTEYFSKWIETKEKNPSNK